MKEKSNMRFKAHSYQMNGYVQYHYDTSYVRFRDFHNTPASLGRISLLRIKHKFWSPTRIFRCCLTWSTPSCIFTFLPISSLSPSGPFVLSTSKFFLQLSNGCSFELVYSKFLTTIPAFSYLSSSDFSIFPFNLDFLQLQFSTNFSLHLLLEWIQCPPDRWC